ncbi:MAG: hypothetical protein UY39_C0055G0004 [Candidatus Kaiserbacteria bacterium GW2011_GWC2_49_12]|uniref:Uncharacterized protein n=1 Tax=Candidatus Kaiserbacteria bacterium GW2011_GWC2_49_12 TaxID=1618675 RepID=A0A0G1XSS8_9BACT|nr:MAG: hypothetical protein UY39_C0055G0004 [Candidatus Kaiserbacteria bacterium GW2011_GWC2_49_12]
MQQTIHIKREVVVGADAGTNMLLFEVLMK